MTQKEYEKRDECQACPITLRSLSQHVCNKGLISSIHITSVLERGFSVRLRSIHLFRIIIVPGRKIYRDQVHFCNHYTEQHVFNMNPFCPCATTRLYLLLKGTLPCLAHSFGIKVDVTFVVVHFCCIRFPSEHFTNWLNNIRDSLL